MLTTPEQIRTLQRKLYCKAKQEIPAAALYERHGLYKAPTTAGFALAHALR